LCAGTRTEEAGVAKLVSVSVAVLCSTIPCSGCNRSGPGGEIEIGPDEAAAVLALESGEDGSHVDFADASGDAPALQSDCSFASLRAAVFAHYDRDHDGSLDAAELAALRADFGGRVARVKPRKLARLERIKWLRWIYDANADRKLDLDEWRALKRDLDARCQNRSAELVQRFDRDGNGWLDAGEWDAARAAQVGRFAEQHARAMAEGDVNHDRKLSARERTAEQERMRQRIDARWEQVIDRFDADRDGVLSTRERSALREYARSVVRDERSVALPLDRVHDGSNPDDDAGVADEATGGA
jgi:Ca2+-binding EF-hand superfamily protein